MPGLPSPRYSELRTQTIHEANAEHTTKPEPSSPDGSSEAFLGLDDEERAWSDITARDPGMARRRVSRRQRVCSVLMSMRSLLDTVLLLVIVGLLLERGQQRQAWLQVGGDLTGFAPTSKTLVGTVATNRSLTPPLNSLPTNQNFRPRPRIRSRGRRRLLH